MPGVAGRGLMRRRAALAALLLPAFARAAPAGLSFTIQRNGTDVGTHRVRFLDEGPALLAISEVRIAVRLGGFTVFRYENDTTERWLGDSLAALDARLARNGRETFCAARRVASGIALRGAAGEALLPPDAVPLTWWRAASLAAPRPLFDPRRGEAVRPEVTRTRDASGLKVRVAGAETFEAIYDPAGTWIGLSTQGEDGSTAIYRPA
jgi:hypothetical protein